MKILQILPELNVGGVETGTVDLARYLVRHGHTSVVVSNGGSLVSDLEKGGSTHYCLPVHKKSLPAIYSSIKKLRSIILKEDIDIVHARSRVPAWIAYLACRKTKATFITTCHGYYSKHVLSRVMGWAKLIITPSEVIARHMIEDFGVSPECIRLIPRSVDLKKFNIPHANIDGRNTHVITIVGRITPLKGHAYFLKAMAKVVRIMPSIRIRIIGDAPHKKESYRQELEILVRRLGLSDYVEFLGNRKDIPQLLSKTDVLVLSTITQEAFGRVILEAQAAGVPVVATKVGGVVEIIDDEKTGILVLPKDTDAMARAVIRVMRDKSLSQRLVKEAKKKLKTNFTLDQMAGKTLDVYKEILALQNILVIKLSSVGDVVLVTASLKALRTKYPNAKIHCLVGEESRKVLSSCPYIDQLMVIDTKHRDRGWLRLVKFAKKLSRNKYDIVVDFQNNRKSHLLSFLSFPRESVGYNNDKWGFLITNPVVNPVHNVGPVQHQYNILRMLGIQYNADDMLELWPSEDDRKYIQNILDEEWIGFNQSLIGINLAASEKWETKNWPIEYIAQLCDVLANQNIRVVITGTEKDRGRYNDLVRLTGTKPADFIGKTDILQLAALIERCKVYITPDSAPMHVAAAVGTPFIAFFGPTSSVRHIPPAYDYRVFDKKLECAPCYSQTCPIQTHACMKEIRPEDVVMQVKELMTVNV